MIERQEKERVLLLFSKKGFEKCRQLESALAEIQQRHSEFAAFVIDPERNEFLAGKLQVKVLPEMVLFVQGVVKDRVVGFEGFSDL